MIAPQVFLAGLLMSVHVSASNIVDEALALAGEPGGVIVQEVSPDHPMLQRVGKNRLAVAFRTSDGGEWILADETASTDDFVPAVQHEVAHIITWRHFGIHVREHGGQFVAVCRRVVTHRAREFCRRL